MTHRPRRLVRQFAWLTILSFASAFSLAEIASAHGGSFRGPTPGPGTGGGPGGGGSPGPRTGGLGVAGAPTSWSTWWEYNKDPYLRLRDSVHSAAAVPATGQGGGVPVSMAPTETTKRDRVLPVLAALCDKVPNRDVQTACLIAMAKIGLDRSGFELLPFIRKRLTRGNQEIRETAALSLGLSRREGAIPSLQELALDLPAGRRASKTESVDNRTRAFAIYGLSLIAERVPDLEVQQRVADVLVECLEVDQRDIQVAALKGLGVMQLSDSLSAGHKRLRWTVLAKLWEFFSRDLGKGTQVVQSHAATSIAQLLGRGTSVDHELAKSRLADELTRRRTRSTWIVQSSVIALGKLVVREELHPADAEYSELLEEYAADASDQLARYLSWVALGEIGGERNRQTLMKAYQKGGKATVKPWAGIALGVLAFHQREASGGVVDTTIGSVLQKGFNSVKNEQCRGASAVALGLAGHRDSSRSLMKVFSKYRLREVMRGYVAIGLALMDATEAIPMLRKAIDKSEHLPLTMMQASIALGKLGDKEAVDWLVKSLQKGNANVARLTGIATAFRFIGDKRVIGRLLDLVSDQELTKLARAFVAAALGGVVDSNRMPWNTIFSVGSNYRAQVGSLSNGQTGVLDIL